MLRLRTKKPLVAQHVTSICDCFGTLGGTGSAGLRNDPPPSHTHNTA